MPMTSDELHAYLVESGTRSIESDSESFVPMLHVEHDGHVIIYALAIAGHPYEAVVSLAPAIITECGAIDRLVFVCDSYMWKGKEEDYVPGPLGERFDAGDPMVSECLMNVVVTANGTDEPILRQIMMPYVRTAEGVTWPTATDANKDGIAAGGRMADMLAKVVLLSHVVAEAARG